MLCGILFGMFGSRRPAASGAALPTDTTGRRGRRRKELMAPLLKLVGGLEHFLFSIIYGIILEETRSHTLEMLQIFILSLFCRFFVIFFVVFFVISVLSVIFLSFFCRFFVISVLSVIFFVIFL